VPCRLWRSRHPRDDVARTATYERIWELTGIRDAAKAHGARLVDFVQAGGREIEDFFGFPRLILWPILSSMLM